MPIEVLCTWSLRGLVRDQSVQLSGDLNGLPVESGHETCQPSWSVEDTENIGKMFQECPLPRKEDGEDERDFPL